MFGERYPEIPHTETLIDHWRHMGFVRVLPMGGYAGFEWQEVQSYNTSMQANLSPVEAMTIVDMSRAYASAISDTTPLSIEPMERV